MDPDRGHRRSGPSTCAHGPARRCWAQQRAAPGLQSARQARWARKARHLSSGRGAAALVRLASAREPRAPTPPTRSHTIPEASGAWALCRSGAASVRGLKWLRNKENLGCCKRRSHWPGGGARRRNVLRRSPWQRGGRAGKSLARALDLGSWSTARAVVSGRPCSLGPRTIVLARRCRSCGLEKDSLPARVLAGGLCRALLRVDPISAYLLYPSIILR